MNDSNKYLQLPMMSSNFPIIDNDIFLIYKNLQSQSRTKFEFNFEYEKNRIDNMFKLDLYYYNDIQYIKYIDYIMMKEIQSL